MQDAPQRSYTPAQLDRLQRLLIERGAVRPDQMTDAKRIARQRQMPNRVVTPIDVLVELGQVDEAALVALEAELAQAPQATQPSIQMGTVVVAVVGIPVLVVLAVMAFKSPSKEPPPRDTIGKIEDFDPREVGLAKNAGGDATADQETRDKALEDWAEKQALKRSPVGRAPTLQPGQAAYVSDKTKAVDKDVQDYFVPFAVVYPDTWGIAKPCETAGQGQSYAILTRPAPENPQGIAWSEILDLSFLAVMGARNKNQLDGMVGKARDAIVKVLKEGYGTLKQKKGGNLKIGEYNGSYVDFEGALPAHADVKLWLRLIIIPPGTGSQPFGIVFVLIGNSLLPDVKSAEDLWTKGEGGAALRTLYIGG